MSPVKQNRGICTLLSRPPPLGTIKNPGLDQNTGPQRPIKFVKTEIFSSQCAFPKSDSRDFFRQADRELEGFASSSNRPGCSDDEEAFSMPQQGVNEGTPKATETVLEGVSH